MDALGTSFLLRFIFLESEIFFHTFCKACEITWLMQPRRAWKFSRNYYFASHVKDMSSAQRKWAPTSRWILEFFPVSYLSYSTVLLNCIREHPHGVVHRDYFFVWTIAGLRNFGGRRQRPVPQVIYSLRGKSLSYQHPGRRCHQHECKAFNIQAFNFIWCSPACVAGTTVDSNVFGRHRHRQVYAFMKSNNSCFWSSKIISSKKCVHNFPTPYLQPRLGSILSVLLQPRGFTGRFGNLWSIAMNFLLLKVLHRWCRASLYSSQGYGCHRHHDVRYMPTSLFFKVDNNTPCKIFRWYTWFESWSTGGGWEQFQNTHLRDCILPRCMFCRGVRNVVLTEHLSTVQFTTTLHLSLMTHFNLQHLHLHISWISDSDGMFGTFHLVGWIANCHIRKSFCCQKPSAERHEQSRQCPCVCQAWAFIAHPVR